MYERRFNPYAANLAVIKGYFKSGRVLIMGILYILSAVLGAAVNIFTANVVNGYLFDVVLTYLRAYLPDEAVEGQMEQMKAMAGFSNMASTFIGIAVTALIAGLVAFAFFNIYVKSRSKSPESNPKTGITILYVLSLISFIMLIIGLILIILGFAAGFYIVQAYSGPYSEVYNIVLIVCAAAVLLVMIYALIAAGSQKSYYKSVKKSISTVELQNKGAGVFGVISVINTVFSGIMLAASALSFIAVLPSDFPVDPTGLRVLSLCASAVMLLINLFNAMIALGYKKYIDGIKYGYNGAPYDGIGESIYIPADNSDNPYNPDEPKTYDDNFARYDERPLNHKTYGDSFNNTDQDNK